MAGRKAASAVTVIRLPSQRDRTVSWGLRLHRSLPSPTSPPPPPFTHPLIRRWDQWGNARDGSAFSSRPNGRFVWVVSVLRTTIGAEAKHWVASTVRPSVSHWRELRKENLKLSTPACFIVFLEVLTNQKRGHSTCHFFFFFFLEIMFQRQEMQQNEAVRKWWLALPAEPNQGQNW